eukprot:GHVU01016298.1.p1 GENE.GHVU01016298.1~~GHVU01016298.1.p1  ORF type:complete len:266 (+),score=30.99 GHVU01016298.1:85-882(+)
MASAGAKKLNGFIETNGIKLELTDLALGNKLGMGGYGSVFKGEFNGIQVAIKKFNVICSFLTDSEADMIINEIKSISKKSAGSHPSVIRFYGVVVNDDAIYMVTELCEGGDLHNKLSKGDIRNESTRIKIAIDIAKGLDYLHSPPVVIHRDLKPQNVVLDGEGNAKICDFGLSRVMTMTTTHVANDDSAGTASYMAPECFRENSVISDKVDIWALGCILIQLFGGGIPFANMPTKVIMANLYTRVRGTLPQLGRLYSLPICRPVS